jgi:putative nucleotidyltransferase with HDIG domain
MHLVKPRIMLVDDEPDLLEVCTESLADMASGIVCASGGLDAVELLRNESFDLIVSDLRMPGVGGLELLRAASGLAPDTDIIVLTGYGTIDSAVECVRLGAVNYLLKPFKVEELRAAVSKALHERALRQSQEKTGHLSHMLALNSALTGKQEAKAMLREFLSQVKSAFAPDGIAFFIHESGDFGLESTVLIGPYFRENPGVRSWFESLAGSITAKGRPILVEKQILREAFGTDDDGRAPTSAMGAAVCAALVGHGNPDGPRGAVVALRANGSAPYTLDDLKLLTLFSAHASLCFESRRACARLKSINGEIVFSLVNAVEAKDTYTRGHSDRVSRYAAKLAGALGIRSEDVELVRTAGMLHDIGKIGVPDSILNKPGPLTDGELPLMRQHPVIARTILDKVESLGAVLPVVYHHHERFDGSGYPDGLKGKDIPYLARLISVVDGFEAMTSDRAYHRARSMHEAKDILTYGSGSQWDPELVQAWIAVLDRPGEA